MVYTVYHAIYWIIPALSSSLILPINDPLICRIHAYFRLKDMAESPEYKEVNYVCLLYLMSSCINWVPRRYVDYQILVIYGILMT